MRGTSNGNAEHVNSTFFEHLKKFVPRKEVLDIYTIYITEPWNEQTSDQRGNSKKIKSEIKEVEQKLVYIRDLLVSKQIEPSDYREMRHDSIKLEKLESMERSQDETKVDLEGTPIEGRA